MASTTPRHLKTKIIATLGPSSSSPEIIRALVNAGASIFRMNFSHGKHEEHKLVHSNIRQVEQEEHVSIAILADLQGPKLRIGSLPSGPKKLDIGDRITFVPKHQNGKNYITLPHPEIFESVSAGDMLLLDDGRIRMQVEAVVTGRSIVAEALNCATILERKGVNFPDSQLNVNPITEKDKADLQLALALGVDWVAMSFVQKAEDVIALREMIGDSAKIISKIEKPVALKNIEQIIQHTDAVMVARGDLGVECPWHEVPAIQASLVTKCRAVGKPVIVATQMLESMINSPVPTRAETSDVANAVSQRADAVMLSAESAAGHYPVEAVESMTAIIAATETAFSGKHDPQAITYAEETDDSISIANAASVLASIRKACCIAAYTETGSTAIRVARFRADVPILAVCPSKSVARPLNLVWGITPIVSKNVEAFESSREGRIPPAFAPEGLVQSGQPVVVTSGSHHGKHGGTDSLKIAYLDA